MKGLERAVARDIPLLSLAHRRSEEATGTKAPTFWRSSLSLVGLAFALVLPAALLMAACANDEPVAGPEEGQILFTTRRFEKERLLGRLFETARGGPHIVGGVHRVLPDGSDLTAIGPQTYDSAVSPSNGSVARVVSDVPEGPSDIRVYVLDERGHRKKSDLTDTPDRCETSPTWSADGTRIAFLSWPRDPELDCSLLPVYRPAGVAPVPPKAALPTPATGEASPLPASGEPWLLEVMNADASGRIAAELPAGRGDLLWAPNGKAIAAITYGPVPRTVLFRIDPDGLTEIARTPAGEREPAWSPDATAFAYASVSRGQTPQAEETRVFLVETDSADAPAAAPTPTEIAAIPGRLIGSLNWSPDSSLLAFVIGRPFQTTGYDMPFGFAGMEWSGPAELWLVNSDGAGLRALVASNAGLGCPAWSPDATRLAYVQFGTRPPLQAGYPPQARPEFLSVIDVSTGEVVQADPDPICPFQWSHSGDRIAYVGVARTETKDRGSGRPPEERFFWGLFVMQADNGSALEVASDAAPSTDEPRIAWSPDDGELALLRNKGCRHAWCSYGRLHVVTADGSALDKLSSMPVDSIIGWVERQPEGAP